MRQAEEGELQRVEKAMVQATRDKKGNIEWRSIARMHAGNWETWCGSNVNQVLEV